MSRTEVHIGKLRKLDFLTPKIDNFADIDVEKWFEQKCKESNLSKSYPRESWEEVWNDEHWNSPGYILHIKDGYYEIIEDIDIEDDDISHISKNTDGTYNYIMKFYNGGTCLSNVLEESIINY